MAGYAFPTSITPNVTTGEIADTLAAYNMLREFDTTIGTASDLYALLFDAATGVYLPRELTIARITGLQTALDDKARFANSVKFVRKVGGVWPTSYDANGDPDYTGGTSSTGVRPSSSSRTMVLWVGPDPSPAVVASGTAGMLDNVDHRLITP